MKLNTCIVNGGIVGDPSEWFVKDIESYHSIDQELDTYIRRKVHASSKYAQCVITEMKEIQAHSLEEYESNCSITTTARDKNTQLSILLIPEVLTNKYIVLGLGNSCFERKTLLGETVILPWLLFLGNNCFDNFEGFGPTGGNEFEVKCTGDLFWLGDSCFANSTLSKINLPDSVIHIGVDCFANTSLSSIRIPNKITTIRSGTFGGCDQLSLVTMGNSVESIERSAFYGTNITDIVLAGKIKSIDSYAFGYCRHLRNVMLGPSIQFIDDQAFDPPTKNPNLCFQVKPYSYAHMWAVGHGYKVVSTDI